MVKYNQIELEQWKGIFIRYPMKELPLHISSAQWQVGWRERLMAQFVKVLGITNSDEFFRAFQEMSKICPSCFCPNLKEFFATGYNSKGFVCPACANSFEMAIDSKFERGKNLYEVLE